MARSYASSVPIAGCAEGGQHVPVYVYAYVYVYVYAYAYAYVYAYVYVYVYACVLCGGRAARTCDELLLLYARVYAACVYAYVLYLRRAPLARRG